LNKRKEKKEVWKNKGKPPTPYSRNGAVYG